MLETPDKLDRSLWFLHAGCTGRHYLLGNPHTFPGRMFAWCPKKRRSFFVSKSEIETTSKSAGYWIAGFLYGSEPEPPTGEDGTPDFDSPEYKRWQRDIERFRKFGAWKVGTKRDA
jgi:hypothetical protein